MTLCLRGLTALSVLAVGCSAASDTAPIGPALPFAEASGARGLRFLGTPALRVISADEAREAAGVTLDTQEEHARREPYRLLGFFDADEAERGALQGRTSFAAEYSPSSKTVTVVGAPGVDVLVHELVHALQDQHFDLQRFDRDATSTDEALARRAVVEGDAVLAQSRYSVTHTGGDPLVALPPMFDAERVARASDSTLRTAVAPYFLSYQAFAYSFGGAYVAAKGGLLDAVPRWSLNAIDALFAEPPRSTEEVIRRGADLDPMVPVGLSRLPEAVASEFEIERVDRLGAWLTRVLLWRAVPEQTRVAHIVDAWDGDQLVVLRQRSDLIPPPPPQLAVVWSSVWDDASSADAFATALARVHGAVGDPMSGAATTRADESIRIARKGARVLFVRGVTAAAFTALAAEAFEGAAPPLVPRAREIFPPNRG